jgi:quercetin dioxygenase-like cupin family protein
MPFINYTTKPKIKIWDGIFGQVHHSNTITCAHISIAAGVQLPQHQHIQEQWSHLLQGEMEFTVDGETRVMKAGETAYMPSNVPHSARTITDCKVIDVFSPVREDWIALEEQQLG